MVPLPHTQPGNSCCHVAAWQGCFFLCFLCILVAGKEGLEWCRYLAPSQVTAAWKPCLARLMSSSPPVSVACLSPLSHFFK